MYKQALKLRQFEEPGRLLLAHRGRRLWAYF